MRHWPVELVVESFNPRCGMWEAVESVSIRGYELPRTLDDYKSARFAAYEIVERQEGTCRIVEVFDDNQRWILWSDGKWARTGMESLHEDDSW
ncbi:MAG: hypothetical protein WC315_00675 [Candidatus Omnitrophota bacterium]|jgi:hypothetical protein